MHTSLCPAHTGVVQQVLNLEYFIHVRLDLTEVQAMGSFYPLGLGLVTKDKPTSHGYKISFLTMVYVHVGEVRD